MFSRTSMDRKYVCSIKSLIISRGEKSFLVVNISIVFLTVFLTVNLLGFCLFVYLSGGWCFGLFCCLFGFGFLGVEVHFLWVLFWVWFFLLVLYLFRIGNVHLKIRDYSFLFVFWLLVFLFWKDLKEMY